MPEQDEKQTAAVSDETAASRTRAAMAETGAAVRREMPDLATATVIGVGVGIVQPELIPGMLIGAGATVLPKLLPGVTGLLRPLVKTVVKAGYIAAVNVREFAAGIGEQFEDIVAESRAEHEAARQRAAAHDQQAPEPQPRPV